MTANLNLRRTLATAVRLAADRFGSWAGISMFDGALLRRVDSTVADDFSGDGHPERFAALPDDVRAVLREAAAYPNAHKAPVPDAVHVGLGVPAALDVEVLVTVPLFSAASAEAVLAVVASSAPPDPGELADFARRVSRAMSVAAAFEERSLLAGTLRRALQPAPLPAIPGMQLGAAYRPAREAAQIGGDFYDVMARPDGGWAFSIGDVCGKGVDAAVLTGQVRQSLRTAALVSDEPEHALDLVNRTLLGDGVDTFVTVAFGVLDPGRDPDRIGGRIALGGHPPGLLLHDGTVTEVGAGGTLVGMLESATFRTVEFGLGRGDALVLYTDGATDARGPDGLLGAEPLRDELADCADLPAQTIADRLMQLVMKHLAGWPHDDIAFLVLRSAG